jgi:class 3 adenylate cyclase
LKNAGHDNKGTGPAAAPDRIRRLHSIGFRISMLVSLAILIFGATAIGAVITWQDRMFAAEKHRQWKILVDALTPNLMNMLASSDTTGINQILDKLTFENEDIHHVYLTNERDRILYSTDIGREGGKLSTSERIPLSEASVKESATGVQIVQFNKKISSGISRLGHLYIGFTYLPSLEKERMISVLTLENAVQSAVKKYLVEMDFYQVNFITKEMMKGIGDVAYFKVLSGDGMIVSSPKESEILQQEKDRYAMEVLRKANSRKPVWTRKLKVKGKPILEVTLGAFDGETKLGTIQVGFDLSSLNSSLMNGRIMMAGFTLFSIVLAIIVAMSISSRISGPVTHLMKVSRQVGEGNLETQAQVASGGDEMRLLGVAFNQMIKGLKERDLVKDTFSRYVTKQVAEEILKDPGKIAPGGKKQEVTILFSDIRGFTAFSEGHDPEEVISHLNEYLSAMVDIIFKYEGTLDKFIGDAIMAVFGSPITHDDDPVRAVKTALEMQKRLVLLNTEWVKKGRTPLTIGIGINTGVVIVGNIGDVRRMEYTVIGDNVNLASRLEDLTKNYGSPIIISATTYNKVKDIVVVNKLKETTVKGKTQVVEIYELLKLSV